MTEIVAADIGGTHARFAIAEIRNGSVHALGAPVTLRTAEHASLPAAWAAFAAAIGRPLPKRAGIAVACPVTGEALKLTNNPWIIRPTEFSASLGVQRYALVNDFAAVAHAVVHFDRSDLRHLHGPDAPLPEQGVISVVGPGTGLGVAQVLREAGRDHVIACEGGHIGFAPLDPVEDAILAHLRQRYGRVSAERVVSGSGLAHIHDVLAETQGARRRFDDEKTLWAAALENRDGLAATALERFCLCLGAVAGDIALAHGAAAVVIGGGLGLRLADVLPRSGFGVRFCAKGRFEAMMARIPVKLVMHPEPGLYGAAAAYVRAHGT